MRAMLLMAAKDLRLRVRDRSVFLIGVVVPFVLAFIFSQILGGSDGGSIVLDLDYGLVDADGSDESAAFADFLAGVAGDGLFDLRATTEAAGRPAVADGELDALWIVPDGFGAAVRGGGDARIDVVGNVDRPTSSAIARSLAEGWASRTEGVALAAATAATTGMDPARAAMDAALAPPAISLRSSDAADRQLDASTFFVAGMAVFFLFFTVSFGVTSLLDEKREGTMARLLAAPVPRWSIVAAKAVVSVVLGVVSLTVLIVASIPLLGAEWGDPVGVALVVVGGVVSAVGVMAVVAAFAKTPEGAGNLQSVIGVGLGMLGGVFFPAALGDGFLGRLALLTPHRWFMTGLGDLRAEGTVASVLPAVGALLAFGIVTGGLAAFRLQRRALT